MANCAYCNSFILFGGVKVGANTFCNVNCQRNGAYLAIAQKIPPNDVLDMIQRLDRVGCPECKGPGPIDVHVSHTVWSALVLTSWRSTPWRSSWRRARESSVRSRSRGYIVGLVLADSPSASSRCSGSWTPRPARTRISVSCRSVN